VSSVGAQGLPKGKTMPDAAVWTSIGLLFAWPLVLVKWLLTRPVGLATLASYVALSTWTTTHTTEQVIGWLVAAPVLVLGGWWIAGLVAMLAGRPRLRDEWKLRAEWRLRALARKLLIYNRRWKRAVAGAGLARVQKGARDEVPRITRVRAGRYVERLSVRMLDGQDAEQWEQKSRALAHSLRSRRVTVRVDKPGRVVLELATEDPLKKIVEPFPIPEFDANMDVAEFLQRVPVGRCDDGTTWRLQVLGKHMLVAGATGSGKGSVIWSTLAQLAPLIREGLVEVWVADPKGGMELGIGRPLFARFETQLESITRMLEQAADRMDKRCDRFGLDGTRLHVPTRADPLILVLIDEIANLTAYGPKAICDRAKLALGRLLSKGRAPAVVVFGALQDPRKEVLQMRSLFPARVCLRVDSREETDMVLGAKAWEAGALCDRIKDAPGTEQGVGYVKLEGARGTTRVRACWWSDDAIRELAARFPWPGAPLLVPREFEAV
jgi:S-DNA-T family DNA segregation ATPase FtsK/SpoIIIE